MAQAGEISILVSVDSKGVEKGIENSNKKLREGADQLRKNANQWAKWGAAAAAAAAVAAGAIIKSQLSTIDALSKTSQRLGIATEQLQGLRNAAEQTGVSSNSLDMALQRMTRRISEASEGSGEAVGALKELGLSAQELSEMTPDEAMRSVADAMQNVTSQSDKVRLAFKLFDSEGVGLVNTLKGGSAALKEYTDEVGDLGAAISDIDASQVEQANDAISRASMVVRGAFQQLAIEAAPIIEAIANHFTEAAREAGGLGTVVENVVNTTIRGFGKSADAVRGLQVVAKGVTLAFQTMGTAIISVASLILEGWQRIFDHMLSRVQGLIDTVNSIPGVPDIPTTSLVDFRVKTLQAADAQREMREEMVRSVGQTKDELHALAMEPLPSDAIEQFVADARAASEEAAKSSIKRVLDGGIQNIGQNLGLGDPKYSPEENEKFLEGLRERFMSEDELYAEQHSKELERLRELKDQELVTEEEYNKHKANLMQESADRSKKIAQDEAKARISMMSSMMGNLANLMNTGSRKMFEVGKAAAIAGALVDGYAAVMGAYKVGNQIGGPWVGAAYAATAAVSTAAQISKIRSSSFSGGAGGGANSFSGGVPATNTAPQSEQQQGGGQGGGTNVSISLSGSSFSPEAVRDLIGQINEQIGDGVNLQAA